MGLFIKKVQVMKLKQRINTLVPSLLGNEGHRLSFMCATKPERTCFEMSETNDTVLANILAEISAIKESNEKNNKDMKERLEKLEVQIQTKPTAPDSEPHGAGAPNPSAASQEKKSGFATLQTEDLQGEYRSIQDSVAQVKLPANIKFSGNKSGITEKSREAANAVSTSVRYVETCIKIIQVVQQDKENLDFEPYKDIDDLLVCLLAHMRYLQEEYASFSVWGNFGPKTQKVFHSLQKNMTVFTLAVIENLKSAVALVGREDTKPERQPSFCDRGNYRDRGDRYRNDRFRSRQRGNRFGDSDTPGYRSKSVTNDQPDD